MDGKCVVHALIQPVPVRSWKVNVCTENIVSYSVEQSKNGQRTLLEQMSVKKPVPWQGGTYL